MCVEGLGEPPFPSSDRLELTRASGPLAALLETSESLVELFEPEGGAHSTTPPGAVQPSVSSEDGDEQSIVGSPIVLPAPSLTPLGGPLLSMCPYGAAVGLPTTAAELAVALANIHETVGFWTGEPGRSNAVNGLVAQLEDSRKSRELPFES